MKMMKKQNIGFDNKIYTAVAELDILPLPLPLPHPSTKLFLQWFVSGPNTTFKLK